MELVSVTGRTARVWPAVSNRRKLSPSRRRVTLLGAAAGSWTIRGAGVTPSPEDLYAVTNAEDLAKLTQRLAASAVELTPGSERPFVVAFYEYPPDLKGIRVRVTVLPDEGTTAAR